MFRLNFFLSFVFILGRFAILLISTVGFDCDGHLSGFPLMSASRSGSLCVVFVVNHINPHHFMC